MLSKSLRGVLFFLVVASLLSCSSLSVNTQTQPSTVKTELQADAPALLTGPIYTQPIDPIGKLFLSSWLDPDGSDYDQYVWDNFTLQTNGTITEIDWFGGYDPTKFGAGGPVLDFSVSIFPSIAAGTEPDVVHPPLAHYQTGGNAGETSIGAVGGNMLYAYAFSLPTAFAASAGVKYWVQIEAFQHGSLPDWCIAGGTGGEGRHFRRTVGLGGGDIFYQFVPGDASFTLLGPLPDKTTPTVTWANPTDITFGTALSGTQLNATASVVGSFVYTPVVGTILNAGAGQILSVDFTPTDSANFNSVLGTTVAINVNKATPTITWANPADITFGTTLSDTQLNATASVPGTFTYTPAAGTILNAGVGQILSVDFMPTDRTNYNSVLGKTVTININKATPTVTWENPADITYGSALSEIQLNATASAPGTFVYTPAAGTILNVGIGQSLSVEFTPNDIANYNNVLGKTVTINVNKATPTVTWANPADITFGTALSGTQLNATASVLGTFVYTPAAGTILNAGIGQILSVDFTPNDTVNYNSVLGTTVTINVVNKTTPIITWANPADIVYGTALGGTQLNAIASVSGTFTYTPAVGTVLNAGVGQTLSVDFTPTDTVNYNNVLGKTVTINVNKATPTVTWANPSDITFGTALSSIQLNAIASVPGTFIYAPAAGTVLNAGAGQILSVDFMPTDRTNYNSVLSTTVIINVNKPTPTNAPGKITGGGSIGPNKGGNKATFAFTVMYDQGDPAPKGNLTYIDHETGMRLSDTTIDFLVIDGTHAWFTGTAMVNGTKVQFEVEIDALSKLGQSDTFYIYIPALNNYSAGGALTGGNITIH
jgi:hypothetical protein